MTEACINKFYIINGNIANCNNFEPSFECQHLIYEVIRVINTVPIFLTDHIYRLENSCSNLNVNLTISQSAIIEQIQLLINKNVVATGNIKLSFYYNNNQLQYRFFYIQHVYPTNYMYQKGVSVKSFKIERPNPNIKELHSNIKFNVDNILLNKQLYEVILINNENNITEGSRSNIFLIKDNHIFTAPDNEVLTGITRKYVIECCLQLGLNVNYQSVNYNLLQNFECAFLTGTSPKVLFISNFDNITYSKLLILNSIENAYNALINNYINNKLNK